VWFSFEFSVILLGIGGITVIAGGVGIYGRVLAIRYNRQLSHLEIERQRQQLRIITAEADKAELAAGIFTFPRTERALLLPGHNMQFIEAVAGSGGEAGAAPALPTGQIELLPLLDRAERVLVKGASDAGKTTVFQHVASRAGGNVTIVDPHYQPGLWPEGARIIGAGRNYGEIGAYLDYVVAEMDSRYKRRAAGERDFQPMTVIIDEFMSITAECEGAGRVISSMIRESRKVGFRLFVGSHSELVKPLGLEGAGDVREGLLIVRLYYSQIRHERRATVDAGEGEQPCQFPPYYGGGNAGGPVVAMPDLVIPPSPAAGEDAVFVRLVREEGKSRNTASQIAYGRGYAGDLVSRGKRALGEI